MLVTMVGKGMPWVGLTVTVFDAVAGLEPLSTVSCTPYAPVALTVIVVVAERLGAVFVGQIGIDAGKLAASGWLNRHQL